MWAWGIASIDNPTDDTFEYGLTIDSFIDRIKGHNSIVYFHNLKFDGRFILDYLFRNGYVHVETKELYEPKRFKTLISNMGRFFSITVRWEDGHSTEFRDSLNKMNMSVARIAESFKLEFSKGEIDYDEYRAPGQELTEEEIEYLRRDVLIIARAMHEILTSGMTKLTVASDALAEFKKLTGVNKFGALFPVLHESIDAEIRRAYRGGFTYADERFKGSLQGNGLVLDVNSLYPSVMRYKELPYGDPEFVKGKVDPTPSRPLTIFSVTFTARLKKDHIPCIQIKGSSIFASTEYIKVIKEPTTVMVTNVDWQLYNDHYHIEVLSYGGGWRFRSAQGMFDTYIDKWSEVKARETGGKREIAKLHLNSLYGKFATNPNVTPKVPIFEKNTVRLVRGATDTREPIYTAAGVFITAYARDLTIRSAQANYSVFAYADTDSLHLLTDTVPESIEVHPTKLGAWKFEYGFSNAFYIRPKAYLERISYTIDKSGNRDYSKAGEYENRIAGYPVKYSSQLTFDDLKEGNILRGKLTPKAVPGGVVLVDTPYELHLS